jgi:hypothetical protein
MNRWNLKLVTLTGGLFGAAVFVSCVVYGLVAPPSLHFAAGSSSCFQASAG